MIVTCQSKNVTQLTDVLCKNRYVKFCEPLRAVGGARWRSFLAYPSGRNPDELNELLSRRNIFKTSTSELALSSLVDSASAILQCGVKVSYAKNNATALDMLLLYHDAQDESVKPRVLPVDGGDLFFKIIFKDAKYFENFVKKLRSINQTLNVNSFLFIRYGGVDYKLSKGHSSRLLAPGMALLSCPG